MSGKRKRTRHGNEGDQKRQRLCQNQNSKDPAVKQALLNQYYTQVLSLREYLLSRLQTTSKVRRKKILKLGLELHAERDQKKLAKFLDQTLIGVLGGNALSHDERIQQWTSFSQRADISETTFANTSGLGTISQSEIVDFAIWMIFSKASSSERIQHLLCQGSRKDVSSRSVHRDENVTSAIPGVISVYPNSHVTTMKGSPWPDVLASMGKQGEEVMLDLILGCGIFLPLESGRASYHQLSGEPLGNLPNLKHDVSSLENKMQRTVKGNQARKRLNAVHFPASITFVRNRILYARAGLNAQGGVHFGLRHIHVLNRFAYHQRPDRATPLENTIHVMMYMFPRQFGLHNVFTTAVDSRETAQLFKDYTLREDEIRAKFSAEMKVKIPKRLRGRASELVQKLQIRHSRCPYKALLEHYCPMSNQSSRLVPNSQLQLMDASTSLCFDTQKPVSTDTDVSTLSIPPVATLPRKPSMMDHASPNAMVSAFSQAVFRTIIPPNFWGIGETQVHNARVFYRNVHRFVQLRRFETLSLHEVSQGVKIADIQWLGQPESAGQKLSQSDFNKRKEIFDEFLYYLFDSILIPLIRANFHVTDSNIHRYRLFYFRHDVWRSLAEPAIASLKLTMFEEIKLDRARKILDSRSLGFSQVRLLPKQTGVRPIMNLRRRPVIKGSNYLGASINSVLAPVYNALSFEKTLDIGRLGSTLFSVGDLYTKLKSFKSSFGQSSAPFYFAKVDVQAAFDTIPQSAVVQLMNSIPSESEYRISKHVELKPGDGWREAASNTKPTRKWISLAKSADDFESFDEDLETQLAVGKNNTIFVENIVNQFRDKDDLLNLLAEHIQQNMVKIGKKFYRQKEGIPQGSVLSSLLCNYFYADLEAKHFSFLQSENSLLLRLIDDFLLITTDRSHAKRFIQVMHDGLPAYGVRVSPDKTLVNFEATVNGRKLPRLLGTSSFPYCGNFVDTKTLDNTKDRERRKDMPIEDSLTVEFSRIPRKTSHRKVLNTFKIQAHAMYLDTSHNSVHTVLSNIYSAFLETATKQYTYNRCLPPRKQPGTKLLIKTISDVIDLAFVLMKGKSRNKNNEGYKCSVKKVQVEWLAMKAFRTVMGKKQSKFRKVLEWLDEKLVNLKERESEMCRRIRGVLGEESD